MLRGPEISRSNYVFSENPQTSPSFCFLRPWGKTVALAVLACAADMGRLKQCHFEALAARSDVEALKGVNKHGRVLYAAVLARLSAERGRTLQPPTESSVQTSGDVFYSGVPVFYSWYTPEGVCFGHTFQGYLAYVAAPMNFSAVQPPAPIEDSKCSQRVTWRAAVRDVKHFLNGGPPVMHLGEVKFQGRRYSLDATMCSEPSDEEESSIHFHAALKRIGESKPQVVFISFEDAPQVHHDFAHHVFVSPRLSMRRAALLATDDRFSISATMSIF